MTDERRSNDQRKDPPSEGVRIIGAEEAAEALERGDVAQRRGDDEPRYGDRPTSPATDGPRPVLRFPLGSSSDPRDIERSPVAPAEPISEPVELPHWTEPPTGPGPADPPRRSDRRSRRRPSTTGRASPRPRPAGATTSAPSDDHEGFDDMQAWGAEDEDAPAKAPSTAGSAPPTTTTSPSPTSTSRPARRPARIRCSRTPPEERFGEAWDDDAATTSRRLDPPARAEPDETTHRSAPLVPPGATATWASRSAVGVALLGLALDPVQHGARAAMVLVTVVIAVAAAELFGVLRQVGYEPVTLAGIVGTIGLVLGAYNNGTVRHPDGAVPHHGGLLALVPRQRRRRLTGDEHRGHVARCAVGRACSVRSPR